MLGHLTAVESSIVSTLVLVTIVCAFLMIGSRWTRVHILGFGLDSVAIGLVALILGVTNHADTLLVIGGLTLVLRGVAFPVLVDHVAQRARAHEDPRVRPGPAGTMLIAAAASILSYGVADELALRQHGIARLGVLGLGAMLSIIAMSFLILIVQRGIIAKLLGILLVDNGILLGGLLLVPFLPSFVEIVVLFDLVAVIAAVGLVGLWMHADAGTTDTSTLNRLVG